MIMKTLLLATLTFAMNPDGEIKGMELPSHPRLLFDIDGIAQLKERINRHDWAKEHWNRIKRDADQ
ncbi:MAG: hypothetical protein ACE5PV_25775, partial [Candidatus Poribacteria bacterium]